MPKFFASAKTSDPDDEIESKNLFSLEDAVNWCNNQRPYGFSRFWISDGTIERDLYDITIGMILDNRLTP